MATKSKRTKKFQKKQAAGQQKVRKHKGAKRDRLSKQAPAALPAAAQESALTPEGLSVDELLGGAFLDAGAEPTAQPDAAADSDEDMLSASDDDMEGTDDDEANGLEAAGEAAGAQEPSSSDDEDDGPVAGLKAQNATRRAAVMQHQREIAQLAERDPEFYAYLQQTDADLLQFGQGEAEADASGSEGGSSEEEGDAAAAQDKVVAPAAEPPSTSGRSVTSAMVDAWCAAAKDSGSLGAMRQLLKAYRVACHHGDSEEGTAEGLRIASSAVFSRLILLMLKEADSIFRQMLGVGGKQGLTPAALPKLSRWRKVAPLIKSYLGNSLHLLTEIAESGMLAFALRRLRSSVLFLAPHAKLQRKFLRQALGVFGSADNAPRVQAILFLREVAVTLPPPALDDVLKGVYRSYVANAKFVNASSVPHIAFMASCIVELYALDMAASYEHAFTAIKQLAQLLRSALSMRTKDAFREVYCWQTINCLELWAKLLAAHSDKQELLYLIHLSPTSAGLLRQQPHADVGPALQQTAPLVLDSSFTPPSPGDGRYPAGSSASVQRILCPVDHALQPAAPGVPCNRPTAPPSSQPPQAAPALANLQELRPLVYPLAQLLAGAVRLVPTPRYFPLRLRCVRCLIALSRATGAFVPTSPLLLEMLQWGELAKAPRAAPAGGAGFPSLALQLRVSKNTLRLARFQEEMVNQVLELLAEHLAQWSCHIAFPELSHLPLARLRAFAKACRVDRFRLGARALADAAQRNVAWVGRARDGVDFSCKDAAQVAGFLRAEAAAKQAPMQRYAALLAQKAEQRRALASTQDVTVGRRVSAIDGASGSEDDEEEGGLAAAAQQEPAEPRAVPAKRRRTQAGPAAARAAQEGSDAEDGELQEYELSEEEDEG